MIVTKTELKIQLNTQLGNSSAKGINEQAFVLELIPSVGGSKLVASVQAHHMGSQMAAGIASHAVSARIG